MARHWRRPKYLGQKDRAVTVIQAGHGLSCSDEHEGPHSAQMTHRLSEETDGRKTNRHDAVELETLNTHNVAY